RAGGARRGRGHPPADRLPAGPGRAPGGHRPRPRRPLRRPPLPMTARRTALLGLVAVGLLVAACHRQARPTEGDWTETRFARKTYPRFTVRLAHGVPVDTVVGAATTYRVRDGDTLLDVARWYDL